MGIKKGKKETRAGIKKDQGTKNKILTRIKTGQKEEKRKLLREVEILKDQKRGDLKNMTEVEKGEKKRKVMTKNMTGREEEKEMLRRVKM